MIGRMGRGRAGRPGLLGTVARTAVVAGTATAVSGRMQRRSAQRQDAEMMHDQDMMDRGAAQAQAPYPPQSYQPTAPQPVQAAAPQADQMQQLKELGEMRTNGLLTPEEFTAAKARILGM
jgi:hypothetical protein